MSSSIHHFSQLTQLLAVCLLGFLRDMWVLERRSEAANAFLTFLVSL